MKLNAYRDKITLNFFFSAAFSPSQLILVPACGLSVLPISLSPISVHPFLFAALHIPLSLFRKASSQHMKKRAAMEPAERSHPHPSRSSSGGAGDFFICFTARPSSSSAASSASTAGAKRVPSSKALMSPARGRDPSSAPALSASLSRRLRSSGSVKGGQSPMFPSGVPLAGRKKGCAFEATEPSSPKVTCIGQVRVKAKKKVKSTAMARSRSSRRGRECCPGRNQSWVHQLPLSICEALRGIGSEFNCFVPCGGRTGGKEKGVGETRMVRSGSSSSCGAVVAKWLLAVQENEEEVKGGEKLEVGFLVREREEKVEIEEMGNRGGEILVVGEKADGGEEAAAAAAARVSVCIPPRNALLLMRCRSDPVKMAALANRFWGSPVTSKTRCEEAGELKEEDSEGEEEVEKHGSEEEVEDGGNLLVGKEGGDAVDVCGVAGGLVEDEVGCKKTTEEENALIKAAEEEQQLMEESGIAREEFSCGSPCASQVKPAEDEVKVVANGVQKQEMKVVGKERGEEKAEGIRRVMEERRSGTIVASRSKERGRRRYKEKDTRRHSFSSELDARRHSFSSEREAKRASFSIDRGRRWSFSLEKPDLEPNNHVKPLTFSATEASPEEEKKKEVTPEEVEEEEEETEAAGEAESDKLATGELKHEAEAEEERKDEAGGEWTELPDCLLMMMYEPKLSMEVSKETWVCGNDFLHWRPQHTRNRIPSKPAAGDNAAPPPPQAAAAAAATVVLVAPRPDPAKPTAAAQQKPTARPAAVAPYEPLVLTRCKSEPVRSSARLAPDACFWKDRHRPIGAAGIGF